MRYRTIGVAAAVLLAAPFMASCRNPRPPGGTTTTMPGGGGGVPGPPAGYTNCGTINKADPPTQAEQTAALCAMGYHGFQGVYVKIVDGSDVIVFQAASHSPVVIRYTVDGSGRATLVKRTNCTGVNSQFSLDGSGNLQRILGNTCNF